MKTEMINACTIQYMFKTRRDNVWSHIYTIVRQCHECINNKLWNRNKTITCIRFRCFHNPFIIRRQNHRFTYMDNIIFKV